MDGKVGSLGEVAQRTGRASRRSVAVLNAGHGEQLLGHWSRDDASTARGRN